MYVELSEYTLINGIARLRLDMYLANNELFHTHFIYIHKTYSEEEIKELALYHLNNFYKAYINGGYINIFKGWKNYTKEILYKKLCTCNVLPKMTAEIGDKYYG